MNILASARNKTEREKRIREMNVQRMNANRMMIKQSIKLCLVCQIPDASSLIEKFFFWEETNIFRTFM